MQVIRIDVITNIFSFHVLHVAHRRNMWTMSVSHVQVSKGSLTVFPGISPQYTAVVHRNSVDKETSSRGGGKERGSQA